MAERTFVQVELADRVLAHLGSGTSVNVVGMRTSGRTALLRHVVEQLDAQGLGTVRITGVGPLQDRALGTLAVNGIHIPTSALGPAAFAGAVSALEREVATRPSVLVVDDADDVDVATTGVIVVVRSRVRVPVLAVSRLPGGQSPQRRPLAEELHPAVRLVMPPLDYGSVLRLVHDLLPGPVDRSTVARIATASGGLPGLVTALIEVGTRTGRLTSTADGWRWHGALWDPSLVQAVEPLIAHLDAEALVVLTMIALSGMIGLRRAARLTSWDALAVLEAGGLIQVVTVAREPVAVVFPPLLARFLAHERSAVRTAQVQDRIVSGSRAARSADGRPASDASRGDQGGVLLPLLDRRFAEHWLAELEDCRREWTANPVPSTAVPLMTALYAAGAPVGEVDRVVRDTTPSPDDPRGAVVLRATYAIDVGVRRHDPDAALARLAASPPPPGYAGMDRAVSAHLAMVGRRLPDAGPLVPSGDDAPLAVEALRAVRISVHLAAGRVPAAAREAADFVPSTAMLALNLAFGRGYGLVVGAELSAGVERALADLEAAHEQLDAGGVRVHAYVAAFGLLTAGRLAEAEGLLSQVLALSSHEGLVAHCHDASLVLAAVTASLQGREERAAALAAQAGALGAPRGPFPWMWPDAAGSLLGTGRADELWALAEERSAAGFGVAAVVAAVEAMERAPDAARARALLRSAPRECALVESLSHLLRALGQQDPDALADAGALLGAQGLQLYATRAAVARALALRAGGDLPAAAEQAQQAWVEAERHGGAAGGLFRPLVRAVDLSLREQEVIRRIGEGLPSSAVAAALGLSVRTVDNHIQNGLRKVGVRTRADVVAAVDTWAAPAGSGPPGAFA